MIVIRPHLSRRDHLIADLWEHGTSGILERESEVHAYFPESLDVSGIVTPENGEIIEVFLQDESATYEGNAANGEPVLLGDRFVVVTSCAAAPTDHERIPIVLADSDAFGSGRHESTQLMVEALEAGLQAGSVIVDVGCGSGILCEVARHLGASAVVACDTHPDSVTTARRTSSEAAFLVGSVDAIKSSVADVVLANICAKVIDVLAADLVRVTKPDGLLLLSGFIQDRTPKRFRPERVLELNGWLCWICRPELVMSDPVEEGPVQPFEAQWW